MYNNHLYKLHPKVKVSVLLQNGVFLMHAQICSQNGSFFLAKVSEKRILFKNLRIWILVIWSDSGEATLPPNAHEQANCSISLWQPTGNIDIYFTGNDCYFLRIQQEAEIHIHLRCGHRSPDSAGVWLWLLLPYQGYRKHHKGKFIYVYIFLDMYTMI